MIDDKTIQQTADSLDVLARAETTRETTLKREHEAKVELLREIQEKFGPLMSQFKKRIQDKAPGLVRKDYGFYPDGAITIAGQYTVGIPVIIVMDTADNCNNTQVWLGWGGKLSYGKKYLNLDNTSGLQFGCISVDTVKQIIDEFDRLRFDSLHSLSKSEESRAACLTAAAELRRFSITAPSGYQPESSGS